VLQAAIEGQGQFDAEFRLALPNEVIRHIKASAIVLKDEQDRPVRMIGINYDITERKQAARDMEARNQELGEAHKQALAATKAKSEFLASMSHEIRTPMNAIVAMADLLQETPLSTEQQEYVGRFSRAAASLLDLINDILDISKIEAGQLGLESLTFDIHDLVDKIGELMAIRAYTKQLEIATFVHPDVPTWVSGDPTRLRQVLVNLVGNAIKFTERGEVVLRVEPNQADPRTLRCSISDTGIGIPADKVESIFESFTQVDSSTTRKYGGTGLGLSISKRLVELMGGISRSTAPKASAAPSRSSYPFQRPLSHQLHRHRPPLIFVTAASFSWTTPKSIA